MGQPFATSLPSNQFGLGAPLGAGNAKIGNSAQDGLFSTLVSLVNGATGAPKLSDIVQIGSPDFTGEAWVNLQMGDVSLSLSSQALTTAVTPKTMVAMIPGILDDLNLDQAVLEGMSKLGETVLAKPDAQSAPNQIAFAKNDSSANDAALLALIAQNNSAAGKTAGPALPVVATSLSEQPSTALMPEQVLLAQETSTKAIAGNSPASPAPPVSKDTPQLQLAQNGQIAMDQQEISAKAIANNFPALPVSKDTLQLQLAQTAQNIHTVTDQITPGTTDNLATQLQRQLAVEGEVRQNPNTRTAQANTQAQTRVQALAQTMGLVQNTSHAASVLSQLPIVQTREVLTSTDPLLIAQNLGQSSTQAAQAALFKPVQAAYQSPQVNVPNVAMEITRHLSAGNNHFQIRLDPAELGRIDVRLHMDDSGNVNARLLVERPETLAMLQRDAQSLERALAQAGLDSSKTNLEFGLKQNPFAGDHFASNDDNNASDKNNSEDEQNQNHLPPDSSIAAYQGSVTPGGVSLWV